jgi:hypothetical protein
MTPQVAPGPRAVLLRRISWTALLVLVVLYVATAITGIPRVHAIIRADVERSHGEFVAWEQARSPYRTAFPRPTITFSHSWVPFPGFVFCSSTESIAPFNEAGHWSIYWIGTSPPKRVYYRVAWIS